MCGAYSFSRKGRGKWQGESLLSAKFKARSGAGTDGQYEVCLGHGNASYLCFIPLNFPQEWNAISQKRLKQWLKLILIAKKEGKQDFSGKKHWT
jgi:hypothetical protein